MKRFEIYEPAMCCSTGVCGVDVDPVLAQFAADLQWLAEQGVEIARYNLSQQPQAFAANPAVVKEMEAGIERLPVVTVDGQVVSTGVYPSRDQLRQRLEHGAAAGQRVVAIPVVEAGGCKPGSGCC